MVVSCAREPLGIFVPAGAMAEAPLPEKHLPNQKRRSLDAEEQVVVPANVTAQIFWLKNRRADKWKDKPEQVETQSTLADTIQAAYDRRKAKEKNGGDG